MNVIVMESMTRSCRAPTQEDIRMRTLRCLAVLALPALAACAITLEPAPRGTTQQAITGVADPDTPESKVVVRFKAEAGPEVENCTATYLTPDPWSRARTAFLRGAVRRV